VAFLCARLSGALVRFLIAAGLVRSVAFAGLIRAAVALIAGLVLSGLIVARLIRFLPAAAVALAGAIAVFLTLGIGGALAGAGGLGIALHIVALCFLRAGRRFAAAGAGILLRRWSA